MDIILNLLIIFAIALGAFFFLYFILNMYDFYFIQKEHNGRIIFKDKMSFICAFLLLIYMFINKLSTIGIILFIILLFSSFTYNFILFSKGSMLLFNNKLRYESIEMVTVEKENSKSKSFLTVTLIDKSRVFKYYLRDDDIEFIVTNFKSKSIKINNSKNS